MNERLPELLDCKALRGELGVSRTAAETCTHAGLAHYHPHDLRHRYISVKVREGVPVPNIAAQVGHSRGSLTLDVYSHVLLDEGR